MPSRFESDLIGTSAWAVLVSVHGEPVSVKPKSASVFTDVIAIFKPDAVTDAQFEEGQEIQARSIARFGPDAFTALGVALSGAWVPATGDRVTARGITYACVRVVAIAPVCELELLKIDERRWGGSGNTAKRGS